jgi:hypothetical protein
VDACLILDQFEELITCPIQEGDGAHSPRILNCLPPEARIHLEKQNNKVKAIPEISADYAAGLMSGIKHTELDVFCEDVIAQNILLLSLPNELRARIQILPIGSSAAVVRHLAARSKEPQSRPCCGFLDGDKTLKKQEHVNLFLKTLEHIKDQGQSTQWIENRLGFLPGTTWPEKWVLSKHSDDAFSCLTDELGVSDDALSALIEEADLADKHDELHALATKLNLPISTIESRFIKCALDASEEEVDRIIAFIKGFLS